MRPPDKAPLEKLGLRPEDDKDGLILHALHMLEGYALNVSQSIEETDAFLSAKILIEECNSREPALIAAHLIRPIALAADPDLTARVMGPRVAKILKGLWATVAPEEDEDGPDTDKITSLIEEAEPAVRHSLLAAHTETIENALREHSGKPLDAIVTRTAQLADGHIREFRQSVREILEEAAGAADPLRQAIKKTGTDEPRLDARFGRTMAAIDTKLLPDDAPGFSTAFRYAASGATTEALVQALMETLAEKPPGKKLPSPDSSN